MSTFAGFAVVALEPETAAHSFEASTRAAQAFRTVGPDREVPDLASVRIRTTPDTAVRINPAADARREGHVEEWGIAPARAEFGFAEGSYIGVVVHDGGCAGEVAYEAAQVEVLPAAYMGGEHHALSGEVHGAAETDPAA